MLNGDVYKFTNTEKVEPHCTLKSEVENLIPNVKHYDNYFKNKSLEEAFSYACQNEENLTLANIVLEKIK